MIIEEPGHQNVCRHRSCRCWTRELCYCFTINLSLVYCLYIGPISLDIIFSPLSNMNYLPTYTSRLVVQRPCQVSFKSMQGCRRSWEDKLKCVKILSVKDHNSAKICRTWIISPHALLDLCYNICTKFHSNPCKDVGGVEKTNFDVMEGRNDGMTKDGQSKH